MTEITYSDLIGTSQLVRPRLAKLDATNPQHRSVVMKAVEILINDYIVPAMDLAYSSSEGSVYFKLEAIASELSGLVRGGFFDPKFPDLKNPVTIFLKKLSILLVRIPQLLKNEIIFSVVGLPIWLVGQLI